MNAKQRGVLISSESKRPPFWRSSTYEEPMWLSLAWIIGPVLVAGTAIYFVLR